LLARDFGVSADASYKLNLLYEYASHLRFVSHLPSSYVLDIVPRQFQRDCLLPVTNPLDLKWRMTNKVEFYKLLIQNKLPHPETWFYVEHGVALDLGGKKHVPRTDLNGTLLFAKTIGGSLGKGAEIVMYDASLKFLRENFVYQKIMQVHSSIRELADVESLSTIRIHSYLRKNGTVEIQSAHLKLGVVGLTDNIGTGGIGVPINLEDGCCLKFGFREIGKKRLYDKHPMGMRPFEGACIPYWKETRDLLNMLHKVFCDLRSVGWDIAITEDGPVVIEGNSGGDIMIPQFFIRPFFETDMIQENMRRDRHSSPLNKLT